ncbi:response regulator transcription factor [Yinghuangia soli]|uniref:Response regulator transcription factor n=1 Tax=Yinghuangia soli TaxID=2908204 RepID=A0AA41U0M4_9ACTN|nr:response regulator transcription factor [Yinghuangia soli]MCF2528751.1 response regulator transcription factor [Yinghuangia soli]
MTGIAGTVLVVDDDPTVAEVVVDYLRRAGFATAHAPDGPTALAMAEQTLPDLVVLDLMLPGMDGLEVCRRLRRRGPVPVVMLTALGEESDRVLGLEIGADDYVTKPFSPRELVLRVRSVLRRTGAAAAAAAASTGGPVELLRHAGIEVDVAAHRVTRDGRELALTAREFDLLCFLLRHPGRVFSREELMHEVWGWSFGDRSTVTVHVRRLREKIEDDPAAPRLLATVWGVGYRLDAGEPPEPGAPGDRTGTGPARGTLPGPAAGSPTGSPAGPPSPGAPPPRSSGPVPPVAASAQDTSCR